MYERILIIGVGNRCRQDDGVGPILVERLQNAVAPHVTCIDHHGEGASLLEQWNERDAVFLADAVQSGAPAGAVFRFDARAERLPSAFFHYSTHAFSVAEAIEMARVLDRLPAQLIVYGIEGKTYDGGEGLSPLVERAMGEVIDRMKDELRALDALAPASAPRGTSSCTR